MNSSVTDTECYSLIYDTTDEVNGLVLKGLEHYVKEEGAMTISSLFFALVHYQALPLTFLFVMFLVGTLLAYSVVK